MSNKKPVKQVTQKKPATQVKTPASKTVTHPGPSKTTQRFLVFGLLTIIFLVFSSSFSNKFINYDDDFYILENPQIQNFDFSHIGPIFTEFYGAQYAPVAFTAIGFVYMVGKFNPIYYIVFGLLMHLTVTYLVFVFIRNLTNKFNVAILTAALFGLATVQVESVTWIAGMVKTVSYSIFFIGALITYLKYVRSGKMKYWAYTLILFILSCLCKEQAVALPLALIVIDIYLKRKLFTTKAIGEKIPFFIISIIFGVVTLLATASNKTINTTDSFDLAHRIVYASYALDNYLGKMIWPYTLSLFYPYPSFRKLGSWVYVYPIILAVILALFIWAVKKKKDYIIFGGLFFLVSILFSLALQIISVREVVMADRYVYVSAIGFYFIVAFGAVKLSEKFKINPTAVYGFFAIYLCLIGYQTYNRTKVFENTISATTDVLNHFQSPLAYVNRGYEYRKQGKEDKAMADYTSAIAVDSTYALAYRNRGVIYFRQNKDELALKDYNNSIKYDSTVAESYANRGAVYGRMGKMDLALKDFETALRKNPQQKDALNNRSLIYYQMGKYKEAIVDMDAYLKLYPEEGEFYNMRALAKTGLKDFDGALIDYGLALQYSTNPAPVYQNRSIMYFQKGDKVNALKDAQQAQKMGIKFDPAYLNALK